jgi:tetratricopeptide (TPR) repeat protein
MACAFERRNNWAIAKKWLVKALKIRKGDMNTLYGLALVSFKLGEYGDCENYCKSALDLDPDSDLTTKVQWLLALTYRI